MMLTVFTPAYNRAEYLKRLHESLIGQKNRDFEWLIIDDGSADDTARVVQSFIEQNNMTIRYYHKANGGKHTAYNEALAKAMGDWFLCVDADDYLNEDAIGMIADALSRIPDHMGIAAYKKDTEGRRLSGAFPADVRCCKISELSLKYGCSGEVTFIFPAKIARNYPFPVFPGEKFVGESVVYDRIEQECQVLLLPQDITVCEYLPDGYSQNFGRLMQHNPSGFCVYFMQRIDLMPSFADRVSCAGKYWCFRWISKNKTLRYAGKHKFAWCLGWSAGLIFRVYYKLFRGF